MSRPPRQNAAAGSGIIISQLPEKIPVFRTIPQISGKKPEHGIFRAVLRQTKEAGRGRRPEIGRGERMLQDTELLQYIHKTAEMGCEGILAVLDRTEEHGLRDILSQQLKDYRSFEKEAEALLSARGERAEDVGAMAKTSARVMSAGKLLIDGSASKIAEMTIEGNTMGITKTIEHIHDYTGNEQAVIGLANRFLSAQRSNVEQLEAWL